MRVIATLNLPGLCTGLQLFIQEDAAGLSYPECALHVRIVPSTAMLSVL